jgi:hypothetical protein
VNARFLLAYDKTYVVVASPTLAVLIPGFLTLPVRARVRPPPELQPGRNGSRLRVSPRPKRYLPGVTPRGDETRDEHTTFIIYSPH